ncbi:MAG: NADH-quinone oxidoreductase subunit M [Myxococcota bacterium]
MKRALFALLLPLVAAAAPQHTPSGGQPRATVEPCALTFPASGGEQSVTIRNDGNAPLAISEVRLSGDSDAAFAITSEPPPAALAPGKSATVKVKYVPGRKAQAFGAVQIVSNDPGAASRERVIGVRLAANPSSLLSWMIFLPLMGAFAVLLLPREKAALAKWVALAAAAVPMALAVALFGSFQRGFGIADGNYGLQFVQHFVWIESFNIEYYVGVDGVSVAMIILTALIGLIGVGASWNIEKSLRGYFAMYLLLLSGMMGVFCAADFFLFYVFWEVMLLPMYFLIGIWGAPPRKEADGRVRGGPYAAIKFFLYTLLGSVLMLLAIIALYYKSAGTTLANGLPAQHTFDILKLAHANDFSAAGTLLGFDFTKVVWIAFFVGFAIKVPMFPFHTWLPDAHVEAPTAISVILAGVLLKMGTYGMLRINFPILPEATRWAATGVAVFGVINILYGAFCAMAQKDLKRMVAYSSISHMGYCLLGMAAFTGSGMSGAMMQMFNHGTITSMLFMLVGVIYDRTHTRGVDDFGGLAKVMPIYSALFGFAFMASLGLPGLSGFIGEVLVFLGSFPAFRVMTALAALGVVLTAAYHLWAIQRVHLGPFNEKWKDVLVGNDVNTRELLCLAPLVIIVIALGFYPAPMLELFGQGVADTLAAVGVGSAIIAIVP